MPSSQNGIKSGLFSSSWARTGPADQFHDEYGQKEAHKLSTDQELLWQVTILKHDE